MGLEGLPQLTVCEYLFVVAAPSTSSNRASMLMVDGGPEFGCWSSRLVSSLLNRLNNHSIAVVLLTLRSPPSTLQILAVAAPALTLFSNSDVKVRELQTFLQ